MSNTLFDKVWDSHVVQQIKGGPDVLFIDRHLVHEVTSPVAFLGLKNRGVEVMSPERTFATADHNTPTLNQHLPVEDPLSAKQLQALEENAAAHGISYWARPTFVLRLRRSQVAINDGISTRVELNRR